MRSAFESTGRAFENAGVLATRIHRIAPYPPVEELFKAITSWFVAAGDIEDDHRLALIRARLARIRAAVTFGLLPFDHPVLDLEGQIREALLEVRQYRSLQESLERIEPLITYLLENPENPKRHQILEFLDHVEQQRGNPVGLVSPRSRLAVPGWGDELRAELRSHCGELELIVSQKRLASGQYCQLVLPWGGYGCPFLYEVFHSYCSPAIDTFVYRCERAVVPAKKSLPRGVAVPISFSTRAPARDVQTVDDHGSPDWMGSGFWAALRSTASKAEGEQASDRIFLVQARLVLLANETKVFLREGSKIIEVSDLVDGGEDAGEWARFPRRAVRDLRAGDLIVLRTSGSGDYLISVADSLMEKDGKGDLRLRALDWKESLRRALEDLGSRVIAGLLESRGHGIQSGHRYIWTWTTHDVIRPRSEGLFYEMVAILQDLGYIESEALETAESRWGLMRQIIRYHHMAGNQIRDALLRKLRQLVKSGEKIDESLALTLPGVESGELSVLRVTAVDPELVEVPGNQIGTVMSLYE